MYPGILCHFPPLFVTNWFSRVTTTLIAAFTRTPQPQGDQLVERIVSQNTYPNRWTSLTPAILPLSGTLKLPHYASLEQKHRRLSAFMIQVSANKQSRSIRCNSFSWLHGEWIDHYYGRGGDLDCVLIEFT